MKIIIPTSQSIFQQNPNFLFTVKIPPFFSHSNYQNNRILVNPTKGVKTMFNIKLDLSRFKKKPIYYLIHPNWPLFWKTDSNWCHFNLLIESNRSKLTRRNSSWLHHRPGLITVVKTQWKWLLFYATLLSFMNCSSQTSKFNSSWWITWADVQRITQPNFKSTSLSPTIQAATSAKFLLFYAFLRYPSTTQKVESPPRKR